MKRIVSYGGGDNSAAMLVCLYDRAQRPDAIVFADTGGEMPRTYRHMWEHMQPWLEKIGFPSITIVRGDTPQQRKDSSLEAQQLRLRSIPSRAFGYGQCSSEWKIRPMEKWCVERFGRGYVKLIGFHADEAHRRLRTISVGYTVEYPLIEMDWGLEECIAACRRVGLPPPGKSSCFYCPSKRPDQIRALKREEPTLADRALVMEAQWLEKDGGGTVKGLGRHWSWAQLLAQGELFDPPASAPEECGEACFT